MVYNVVYKKSVLRDLKGLPKVRASQILDQIEEELSKNADTYPALKGRFAGLRKYRVGDYRIIDAILQSDVVILRIGYRRDVYRKEI